MKVLEHKTTGDRLKIQSLPEKDKPYFTVIYNDGKLGQIHKENEGLYGQYQIKTLDKKYTRGRF